MVNQYNPLGGCTAYRGRGCSGRRSSRRGANSLVQTTINQSLNIPMNDNNNRNLNRSFGNSFVDRPNHVFRVLSQNIGPQPYLRYNDSTQHMAQVFKDEKIDVFLFNEHGLYPPKLPHGHSFHNHMSTCNKGSFTVTDYNKTDKFHTW